MLCHCSPAWSVPPLGLLCCLSPLASYQALIVRVTPPGPLMPLVDEHSKVSGWGSLVPVAVAASLVLGGCLALLYGAQSACPEQTPVLSGSTQSVRVWMVLLHSCPAVHTVTQPREQASAITRAAVRGSRLPLPSLEQTLHLMLVAVHPHLSWQGCSAPLGHPLCPGVHGS